AMDAVEDDNRLLRVRTDHHEGKAIIVTVEDSGPGQHIRRVRYDEAPRDGIGTSSLPDDY
ncbi:MAG: hypothetical protein WAL48_15295, partial [Xanthobacteraceae bacterium]